ncbi:MAG: polysaccharide biosynthesis tyrosine autokinase [Pseudomonadota bacterium]
MNELRAKDYAAAAQAAAASTRSEPQAQGSKNALGIIWRRKWLIAAIIIGFLALGVYITKSLTPTFTASATVKLDVYQANLTDLDSVVTGITPDAREIRSQLQVIRSRKLMGRVVDAMNLTADPEFNIVLARRNAAAERAAQGDGWFASLLGLVGLGGSDEEAVPEAALSPKEVRERAIDSLTKRVTVLPVHFSFVFGISVSTTDPVKSATIVNTITQQYILNQIEVKYQATEQATSWLSNRVAELKTALEQAEEAVADHRAKHQLAGDGIVDQLAQRLASLRSTATDATSNREKAVEKLNALLAAVSQGDLSTIANLTGSIRLENLARTITSNGGPQAQVNATAMTRFNLELEQVTTRLQREISQSDASLAALGEQIAELEQRQAKQGDEIVTLRQLEREAQAAGVIYETFLSRLKETSVQQGVHKADAVVISEARVPIAKSSPRYRVTLSAALILGMLVAATVVAILEMVDQTFSTPDELEQFTGLPVLGLIPSAPITARGNVLKFAVSRPTSPFVEAIRNLRTSVQLSGVDGDVKVVALASAGEGEGKTLLTMALAHSSSTQVNRRVLVMDCDLRRRRLTSELGGRGIPGLIGYFGGKKMVDEIIHTHETGEFDVIYADKSPKITADIFASQKFAALMAELRERYDLIIIDTPPVLALTDIRVISNYVDLVLFSVSWKRTKRRLVRAAMASLQLSNSKRLATVFNRMNIGKSIGYYGSYYYN